MTINSAIELIHVTKHYGNQDVVFSDVCLSLPQGQVIGLVGENGSGKTTFIKLISGITCQDSGEIYVLGQPLRNEKATVALRKYVSIMGDANRALYWNMTGMDNVEYFWTLKSGRSVKEMPKRVLENIERLNMSAFIHKRVETYSKGMKQRLLLLICLLDEPSILFLDEPLNGLDFENAFILKQIISDFVKNQSGTVIITSHDKNFINEVCDVQYVIRDKQIAKCESFDPTNKEIALFVKFFFEEDKQAYISQYQHTVSPVDKNILKITADINDASFYGRIFPDLQAERIQILEVK